MSKLEIGDIVNPHTVSLLKVEIYVQRYILKTTQTIYLLYVQCLKGECNLFLKMRTF